MIIIFSNLPIFPLSNCFLKLLCVGSYRLLKPNCIFGFNLLIFFLQDSIFLILKSSGFSQKIIFLFLTPSNINLRCVDVVEAIKIAFIFLSL